jgi:predicted RNase H-like HicB family nuclease
MLLHVRLSTDEEGWVVAECPALPGCVTQGKTEEESLSNIKEAIQAWLWAEDQKYLRPAESSSVNQILVSV